jgi:hypothetical protein
VWLSEDGVKDRSLLSKEQGKKLLWWRDRLTHDATVGDPIRKSLIPAVLKRRYEIEYLFTFSAKIHFLSIKEAFRSKN